MNLNKIQSVMLKVQCAVLSVCGIGMVLLLSANGLSRYFLHSGIIWGDEITRVLFVWGCFVGITSAFITDGHIGFDTFANWKPWTQKLSKVTNGLCLMAVGFVVLRYGYTFTMQVGKFPLPASRLPIMIMYIAGVLAGLAWILIGLCKVIVLFWRPKTLLKGEEPA